MKRGTLQLVVILGLFATACYAKEPVPAATTDTVKSPRDSASGQASGKRSATDTPAAAADTVKTPRDAASGQASGKRSATDTPAPATGTVKSPRDAASGQATGKRSATDKPAHVFKKVGSGAVVTPEAATLAKKYKDCKYDDKGKITNAPCTGTKKDDKGVTWLP